MSNKDLLDNIKKLRELTGVGFKDCKVALDESNGDVEKSIPIWSQYCLISWCQFLGNSTSLKTSEIGLSQVPWTPLRFIFEKPLYLVPLEQNFLTIGSLECIIFAAKWFHIPPENMSGPNLILGIKQNQMVQRKKLVGHVNVLGKMIY